jgi:hypothetical protein
VSNNILDQINLIEQTFGIKVVYHDVQSGTTIKSQSHRPLYLIAQEIKADWTKVYFGAVPYLDALSTLDQITDRYYEDDAEDIVRYFLSNATTWKGDTARRIKAELKDILKGAN